MNDQSTKTATGYLLAEDATTSNRYLRQHCLDLALNQGMPSEFAHETAAKFYNFIKGEKPIPAALRALTEAFNESPGFAHSWHCNLACPAMDEGVDHATANRIASRTMKHVFGVETSNDMLNVNGVAEEQADSVGIPHVTRKVVFRAIMSGENLADYLALRDRYDLGEVNYNGFVIETSQK